MPWPSPGSKACWGFVVLNVALLTSPWQGNTSLASSEQAPIGLRARSWTGRILARTSSDGRKVPRLGRPGLRRATKEAGLVVRGMHCPSPNNGSLEWEVEEGEGEIIVRLLSSIGQVESINSSHSNHL